MTAQNHRGQTALLVSIEEGHWKTARELLSCPDEETRSVLVLIPDDNGQSPLHVLCKGTGDYRTINMLLTLHADVQMHDKNRRVRIAILCHLTPLTCHLPLNTSLDPAPLRVPLRFLPHGVQAPAGGGLGVHA